MKDKVLCVNSLGYTYITVGKWYELVDDQLIHLADTYKIIVFNTDNGISVTHTYSSDLFKNISEIREEKLNQILECSI
jgi:hypothetical protein